MLHLRGLTEANATRLRTVLAERAAEVCPPRSKRQASSRPAPLSTAAAKLGVLVASKAAGQLTSIC